MPTRYPRLNVVLEPAGFRSVKRLAVRDGVSLSMEARHLIQEALELHEDAYWVEKALLREKSFRRREALSHEQVWGPRTKRQR